MNIVPTKVCKSSAFAGLTFSPHSHRHSSYAVISKKSAKVFNLRQLLLNFPVGEFIIQYRWRVHILSGLLGKISGAQLAIRTGPQLPPIFPFLSTSKEDFGTEERRGELRPKSVTRVRRKLELEDRNNRRLRKKR
jgi:hypothetical protein